MLFPKSPVFEYVYVPIPPDINKLPVVPVVNFPTPPKTFPPISYDFPPYILAT